MPNDAILYDADTNTVTVPMTSKDQGERKLVIAPNGAYARALPRVRTGNTMVQALARANIVGAILDER